MTAFSRDDLLRLTHAAKCLALMPGSLRERIRYAHKYYVGSIEARGTSMKCLEPVLKMIEDGGGLDQWLDAAGEESLQDYAVCLWDTFYVAVIEPTGL